MAVLQWNPYLGSVIPSDGKILIINNGAYGARMVQMARCLKIDVVELRCPETEIPSIQDIEQALEDAALTHVACVHCETTTGLLNPIAEIGQRVKAAGKTWIVDAMSSFGGVPMDIAEPEIDFLISSANKCIQVYLDSVLSSLNVMWPKTAKGRQDRSVRISMISGRPWNSSMVNGVSHHQPM